jgi:Type IV secretion-system coupling protein DNA-binding domain.
MDGWAVGILSCMVVAVALVVGMGEFLDPVKRKKRESARFLRENGHPSERYRSPGKDVFKGKVVPASALASPYRHGNAAGRDGGEKGEGYVPPSRREGDDSLYYSIGTPVPGVGGLGTEFKIDPGIEKLARWPPYRELLDDAVSRGVPGGSATPPGRVSDKDLTSHCMVMGTIGSGKSSLMFHLFTQQLKEDRSAIAIDVKWESIEKYLWCCQEAKVPPEDVVVIDPTRPDAIPAWPLLGTGPGGMQETVNGLMDVLDRVEKWGNYMERAGAEAMTVAVAHRLSIMELYRLIKDKAYRDGLLALPAPECDDPRAYAHARDALKEKLGDVNPILNRLGPLVDNTYFQGLFSTRREGQAAIDFEELWYKRKVILVHLPPSLKPMTSKTLAGLVSHQARQAAAARKPGSKNHVVFAVDELGLQADLVASAMQPIVSLSREQRLRVLTAFQFLGQLPDELADTLVGQTKVKAFLRLSGEDARQVAIRTATLAGPEGGMRSVEVREQDYGEWAEKAAALLPFRTLVLHEADGRVFTAHPDDCKEVEKAADLMAAGKWDAAVKAIEGLKNTRWTGPLYFCEVAEGYANLEEPPGAPGRAVEFTRMSQVFPEGAELKARDFPIYREHPAGCGGHLLKSGGLPTVEGYGVILRASLPGFRVSVRTGGLSRNALAESLASSLMNLPDRTCLLEVAGKAPELVRVDMVKLPETPDDLTESVGRYRKAAAAANLQSRAEVEEAMAWRDAQIERIAGRAKPVEPEPDAVPVTSPKAADLSLEGDGFLPGG